MKPITVDFLNWIPENKSFAQELSVLQVNNFNPSISTYFVEYLVRNPKTGKEVFFSRRIAKRHHYIANRLNNDPGTYIDADGEILFWVYEPIGLVENSNLKDIRLIIWND